mgnify:CR=1 FL=1
MEGGGEEAALASGYGSAVTQPRQHLDSGTNLLDDRGADEDRVEGRAVEAFDGEFGFEGVHLAAEGVALHGDVHGFDAGAVQIVDVLGEEDGARAGSPDWSAAGAEVADINFRFLPAIVAGLAYHIAMKVPELQARLDMLKAAYEEQFDLAAGEDREKAAVRFVPRRSYIGSA